MEAKVDDVYSRGITVFSGPTAVELRMQLGDEVHDVLSSNILHTISDLNRRYKYLFNIIWTVGI